MKLYIKNMVCDRCIMAVRDAMTELSIPVADINLGEVQTEHASIPVEKLELLAKKLSSIGFELIDDKKSRIIDRIKTIIIENIHYSNHQNPVKLSVQLSEALHYDYNYLSNLFSSIEGMTIEHYHILQRIEKAKEWLAYDEYSLSQIADKLGYSSVAYLSGQFKKVTGLTPTQFKELRDPAQRKPLDKL